MGVTFAEKESLTYVRLLVYNLTGDTVDQEIVGFEGMVVDQPRPFDPERPDAIYDLDELLDALNAEEEEDQETE